MSTTIVQQLLQLQCDMQGCRRPVSQWKKWAKRTLPAIWEQTRPSPLEFCLEVHRLMVSTPKVVVAAAPSSSSSNKPAAAAAETVKFQDWRWDFLSALFEEETCNCVCGTLYILSAAEYVGLFPAHVHAMVGPNHIWVAASTSLVDDDLDHPLEGNRRRREDTWKFVETTLRPGHDRWFLTPARARKFDIYARGSWYPYCTARAVVQEAFINQIISSAGRQEVLVPKLWQLLSKWSTTDLQRLSRCRRKKKKNKQPLYLDWVLDLQHMRQQQLTHRDASGPAAAGVAKHKQKSQEEQLALAHSLMHSMCAIQEDATSRQWDVGPDAYLRTLVALAQWAAWSAFCCNDAAAAATKKKKKQKHEVLLAFLRQQANELQARLLRGQWTMECPILATNWEMLRRLLSFCHASSSRISSSSNN